MNTISQIDIEVKMADGKSLTTYITPDLLGNLSDDEISKLIKVLVEQAKKG